MTGYVPDIEVELRRADVVTVPIRYGGGTRIKIIEALAHGIPIVSTRMEAHERDDAMARIRGFVLPLMSGSAR